VKDVRPALRQFLLDDATVSGLVGGVRIHNTRLPQDQVSPSVVYTKVSETGDYHMEGDSGLGQVRMQVDAWAQNADAATELANAIHDRLSGARQDVTVGSDFVRLKGVFLANGRDDYDNIVKLYRVSRDFLIWYGASE
jgi:Protein of unknown function (DUF3168)